MKKTQRQENSKSTSRIQIRGRTEVIRTRKNGEREGVKAIRQLQSLHGRRWPRITVLDCLQEGAHPEIKLAKSIKKGGEVRLDFDKKSKCLWVVTDFELGRPLNKKELTLLIDSTVAQWSDGFGTDFSDNCEAETGLFVDLFPMHIKDYNPLNPEIKIF